MAQSVDNTITNSGPGEQSIAQGPHAIGKQVKHIDASGASIGVLGDNVTVYDGINFNIYPRTPQGIPLQRPPRAEYFKGRDEMLKELLPLLQPGKAVTLCGPGGIGKTALAAQVTWSLAPADAPPACFPDGIIFYSFYGKHTAEEALAHVVRSYDEQPQDVSPDAARRLLASKRALVILDGAEEADDLSAVLRCCCGCGVLITSRRRSDAQGGLVQVRPLDEQPAEEVFRLYCSRDTACRTPTADDPSVAAICKILGGWPVGLRIAGRYLRSTGESAADYLKWLEKEPFKELGDGLHQQDNAALLLRRSVEQVNADARLALGVAGTLAFASLASEPLIAMLEGDERRARTALGELVNYGLLLASDGRWQISHALVHTYARAELALSRENLVKLSSYYITFCLLPNAIGVHSYAQIDRERVHCLRLMEVCLSRQLWLAVQLLEGLFSEYLDLQSWWTERLTALAMRLTAARQAGERSDEALCLNNIGYTHARRKEYQQALIYYEQCLKIRYELDDRKETGKTLNNIGSVYREQGKHEQAVQLYMQSLSIALEIGDKETEAEALNNIGAVYHGQGNHEKALRYYEQCLPIRQEVGYRVAEGATLNNIAEIYRLQGKPAKALENYKQALMIAQEMGNREGKAITCWNISLTYRDLKDLAKTEEYISQAVRIAEQIGHPLLEEWREGLAQVQAVRQG